MKKQKIRLSSVDVIITGGPYETRNISELSPKTRKRIKAGLKKFFGKDVDLGLDATSSDTKKKYKRKT